MEEDGEDGRMPRRREVDVMLEIKDKKTSVLKAMAYLAGQTAVPDSGRTT